MRLLSRARFKKVVVFLVVLFSLADCIQAEAQTARMVAQTSFPSVVLLVMEDANGQQVFLGSGFFVRENIIASNFHVVQGASSGYARLVNKKTKYGIAGIVGSDTAHDLVLLAITDSKAPTLPLADSRQVAVGDEVFVVGNPQGFEGTFSQGIVSSIREDASKILLQITAPISPGSSGGPVLNAQGKVIGIAVATFKGGQNLNFAIPANYLASLVATSNPSHITPLEGDLIKKPIPPRRPTAMQPGGDASSRDSAGTSRPGGFSKMIKAAMQQQVVMKLTAMKARLHLTDEQAQVVRELLEKQLGTAGDMAAEMFEGKASEDDLITKPSVNLAVELKKILTPSQWDGYRDYQIEERHTQSRMVANAEILQLQSLLHLSPQQRDQVFNIIAEQTLRQLNTTDGGMKMSADWEQTLNAKRDAVRALLTPDQQQAYDKFVESQREMIKSLLSGGKRATP